MKKIFYKLIGKKDRKKKLAPDDARRIKIVNYYNIDTLFDIGANIGQYGVHMRKLGYDKKIVSFEPVKSAFDQMKTASLKYDNWVANHYALGDADAKTLINIAGNSLSSSILDMLPAHLSSAPESQYTEQEEIEVKKLDSVFSSFTTPQSRVMLKIDTQGYEKNVLEGAAQSLKKVSVIQLEMSIIPLYQNEMIYTDMIAFMEEKGFQLFALENGFDDPVTGRLLQVDGIFVNKAIGLLNS